MAHHVVRRTYRNPGAPRCACAPEKEPVPPAVWGPKAWAWLHREAVDYPDAPSDRDRLAASIRFWSFVQSLPCENCRFHMTKYARRSPPDFRSSAHYQAWAWRIHNLVNRRLRKPLMTPEEYSETYAPVVEASYWRHV